MTDRQFVIDFALSLAGTSADCPFEEDFFTTVLRHKASKKWFGILLYAPLSRVGLKGEGKTEVLNLKCDPFTAELMRENFSAVQPAYHMNKNHWISVVLDGDLPNEKLEKLIVLSYELTGGKNQS